MQRSRVTLGRVGAVLLGGLVFVAATAPWLAPYDPHALVGAPLSPPSPAHWLGTDDLGQDILSALIYGTRLSLGFGVIAAAAATVIAAVIGLGAGFARGIVDAVLMRLVDAVLALPVLPLTIVLGAFLGAGISSELLVVCLVMWARPARELRSQALSVRERGEVQAALAMGGSAAHVIARHIVPHTLPLLVPQYVRLAKAAIMLEASLSFLGLGDPTSQSWGTLLYYAQVRSAFLTDAWAWWVIPPGLGIATTVVAFAFIGYAVEERTRPALRRRRLASDAVAPDRGNDGVEGGRDGGLLQVTGLTVDYDSPAGTVRALDRVSLRVERGEVLGVIGESGSGKTTLAHAVLGLLSPQAHRLGGTVRFEGRDMLDPKSPERRRVLGDRLALIPQSAMNALNPVVPVIDQVIEAVTAHRADGDARARASRALEMVGIPADRFAAFPHEFSGGMRQRVLIAMALVNDPQLVVADEVTSGLDVIVQSDILRQIGALKAQRNLAIVFISHDLPTVLGLADRLAVMRAGRVVEEGPTARVLAAPEHSFTKTLLATVPRVAPRSPARARDHAPPVVELRHVSKTFAGRWGHRTDVRAVDDVSLTVGQGEVVGLVGGSGAGKSTIARMILSLVRPDHGVIAVEGRDVHELRGRERRARCRRSHLVFQDPYQSLAPHWRVEDIVAEPLDIHGMAGGVARTRMVHDALATVSLLPVERFARRFPHELSGGERQRVALARAAVHEPSLIVADEPTSLLDATLRGEVVAAMETLRDRSGTAFLYITHDLALAQRFCDRLLIMHAGAIVEEGNATQIIEHPAVAHTAALVGAAFPEQAGTVFPPLSPGTTPVSTVKFAEPGLPAWAYEDGLSMTSQVSKDDLLPCGCAVPGETDAATCYCGVENLLRIIRRKYALAVMNVIHGRGTARYQEVATALPAASSSTLAETLRALTAAGLTAREADSDAARTRYSLTSSGEKLLNRLRRLLDEVQP